LPVDVHNASLTRARVMQPGRAPIFNAAVVLIRPSAVAEI